MLEFDNIFDLISDEPKEAADMKFRADLMLILREFFELKKWEQSDVMRELRIKQPRASELMRGKIDKFSAEKLIGFLYILGFKFKPKFDASKPEGKQVSCNVEMA